MLLLSATGLTRRPWFEGRHLALVPGEIVVLSGASGAGKTLFLRALADLDPVDAGTVELAGGARSSFPPTEWRRNVLYVHPRPPSFPGTVGANLERVRALAPEPRDVPRELPSLDPALDAERLSSGEAQLLALHRALAVGPRVLLCDEATSGLDPERARGVEETLAAWVREDRAILWVSHDAALAGRLGARRERFP